MFDIVFGAPRLGSGSAGVLNGFRLDATQVSRYSHAKSVRGTYESASIEIPVNQAEALMWVDGALGADIRVEDKGHIIWRGFVEAASINLGQVNLSLGPVTDIANRVRVVWTTETVTVFGLTVEGTRVETAYADDLDSQSRYGIWEREVNAGTRPTDGTETQIRDAYLAEYAWPTRGLSFDLGGSSPPTVVLECRGYYDTLNAFGWGCTTPGSENANARILTIGGDDPNDAINWLNTAFMQTNTLQIPCEDDDTSSAIDLIEDIVSRGDAQADRWVLGLTGDDVAPVYREVTKEITYLVNVQDNRIVISDRQGNELDPWLVEPGYWVAFNGLFVEREIPDDISLYNSPDAMFIESLTFNAPRSLTLSGGKTDTLSQKLAQLGLGGI